MISHDPPFIFIHIPKTGGTSVYRALAGNKETDPQFGYSRKLKLQLQHLTIAELLQHGFITEEQLNTYFKFCFVRNPWDLVVSEWQWRRRTFPRLSLDRYLKPSFPAFLKRVPTWKGFIGNGIRRHLLPQYHFIHDQQGALLVDYVGRFETLEADFNQVCQKIGLPDLTLPHANQTKRDRDYRKYYDDETYSLVKQMYQVDIDYFGFDF